MSFLATFLDTYADHLAGADLRAPNLGQQKISSAATSRRQVPALLNPQHGVFRERGGLNFDLGGGKYDLATEHLWSQYGVENLVYDPFNRSPEHNQSVLNRLADRPADSSTILNVLNVIQEPEDRRQVLELARSQTKDDGRIYISVYIRDGNNSPTQTRDGLQLNRRPSAYLAEIESVFGPGTAEVVGNPDQKSGTGFILVSPAVVHLSGEVENPDRWEVHSTMLEGEGSIEVYDREAPESAFVGRLTYGEWYGDDYFEAGYDPDMGVRITIGTVFVLPDYRRMGIATLMYAALADEFGYENMTPYNLTQMGKQLRRDLDRKYRTSYMDDYRDDDDQVQLRRDTLYQASGQKYRDKKDSDDLSGVNLGGEVEDPDRWEVRDEDEGFSDGLTFDIVVLDRHDWTDPNLLPIVGRVAGAYDVDDEQYHIHSIDVAADYRRMGIGTLLWDELDRRFGYQNVSRREWRTEAGEMLRRDMDRRFHFPTDKVATKRALVKNTLHLLHPYRQGGYVRIIDSDISGSLDDVPMFWSVQIEDEVWPEVIARLRVWQQENSQVSYPFQPNTLSLDIQQPLTGDGFVHFQINEGVNGEVTDDYD